MHETCYMCEAVATSHEHVPPRCIFPEKDKWRKNLITVPSCDLHNLQKSKDDEVLRSYLTVVDGINYLGTQIGKTKVIRGLERSPHHFPRFFKSFRNVQIDNMNTGAFSIDLDRFNSSIKTVVRGLFYFDFKKKLLCDLDVAWTALRPPSLSKVPEFEFIEQKFKNLPPMTRGSNPKIFLYDYNYTNNNDPGLCRMQFYEGAPICVFWTQVADNQTSV